MSIFARHGAIRLFISTPRPRVCSLKFAETKAQSSFTSAPITSSTVRNGNRTTEEDEANPISVYGESKRAGEENVLAVNGRNLVVRVSWVFGPDRPSFIDGLIKRAQENEHVDAIANKFSTPTYTLDIAEMLPQFF